MKENMFTSIDELNAAVREHKQRHDLSATERAVLDLLSQYSCVNIGESFLAKSTIAERVGKSRRTIIRVCNRLEALGIIVQYKRMRKTGDKRQTSNLIVILPIEPAYVTPECHSQEPPQLNSKSINNNHLNVKRSLYVKYVPQSLQHYGAIFGANLRDLYGRVWLAAKKLGIIADQSAMQQVGFAALERLKQYVKQGEQLSEDQQRKLAYKIAYNQLQQGVESGDIFDISDMYAVVKQANK